MLDWIVEGIRFIVWGLTAAALSLMDICYDLVVNIASADFLKSATTWKWYYVLMTFLGVLILVKSFSVFLKFSFDEEFRDKVTGVHFINKFISIALAVIFIPIVITFISSVSVWGIKNISMVVGTQADKPSTFVITSFMNTDNGKYTEDGKWVAGSKVTYTLKDVDINKEGKGDDDFLFFNDIQDLFIIFIIGLASAAMLIMNGIQIGKRMYSLVMKVLIAPLPISSMIVPGDETFSMWRKMIVSDYILNYFQTLMIIIVMILSGSKVIQDVGVWAQILSYISGLLLLLSGVPELAKIVGGDTSQANILQQIASFRLATKGIGSSIGNIARTAGGALGTTAAAGTYGLGRMMGGNSMAGMEQQKKDRDDQAEKSGGFMGGSGVNENQQTGFSMNQVNQSAGEHTGPTNMNASNHASADSTQNATNQTSASFSQTQKEGNINESGFSAAGAADSNRFANTAKANSHEEQAPLHSSKEGTKARTFSNTANNMTGTLGFSARFAANTTSHLYQHSQQKLQNTRIYRAGKSIHNLGNTRKED